MTAGVGLVSLAADAVVLACGDFYRQGMTVASVLSLVEVVVLLTLTLLAVRRSRAGFAVTAGILAGLAVPSWQLRFGPPTWSGVSVGGYTTWATLAALAVVVGLYLRALDERRTKAVAAARRAGRLMLADDLHDFVVHDVHEMLLQAQAGQVLLGLTPGADGASGPDVGDVLHRIERTALRALETVDRSIHLLHDAGWPTGSDVEAAPRSPQPAVCDLPGLVDRFAAVGPVAADLDLEPELAPAAGAPPLPREVSATVYRIVVEALTNVRRHAVGATYVRVTVARAPGDTVRVEVTDDGGTRAVGHGTGAGRSGSGRGAFGLAGLAARVDALGGKLTAGPTEPTGWRVTAVLPVRAPRPAGPLGLAPIRRTQ
ncbi:two-component sensor histidine kinase [Planotetraspora sp. A-T 1434]|uniref:sensor histidine kinase n=1 Tax=Planotetraspora sp. A-T 1434 TaxID=2979219 RepID=UPI0021BE6FA8|nr:sensor histidine kinase [Planotetraspora sp. A-T 1434]MCT9931489.1 two-component sensor histidine kinase [Planotetraspora sp. A-T 1434]